MPPRRRGFLPDTGWLKRRLAPTGMWSRVGLLGVSCLLILVLRLLYVHGPINLGHALSPITSKLASVLPWPQSGTWEQAEADSAANLSPVDDREKTLANDVQVIPVDDAQETPIQETRVEPNTPWRQQLPTKNGSVAICVVGGLRTFELTVGRLAQNLFSVYSPADVFVHAPLDENSHKVLLLSLAHKLSVGAGDPAEAWSVRAVEFLAQGPLDEATKAASVLLAHGSPHGVQGLLQYFQLIEGCLGLIQGSEQSQGFQYDWVVRTRPDAFWMRSPPNLHTLGEDAYIYPEGSRWNGHNDRLGISKRHIANFALKRLSVLDSLSASAGAKGYNSELCLKRHLEFYKIPARAAKFPFCLLTTRTFSWPPPSWGIPVFALNSTAPANGGKCRPCEPVAAGPDALKVLDSLGKDYGLPWDPPRTESSTSFELCNASAPLGEGWELIFESQAGFLADSLRDTYSKMGVTQCTAELERTLGSLDGYSGPSAALLCQIKDWAPVFAALVSRTASARSVVEALAVVNPGRPFSSVADDSLRLDEWDGVSLPLPRLESSQVCDPCHLVVAVTGHPGSMQKKAALETAMKDREWNLLKCGGAFVNQTCLFVMNT